MIGGISGVSLNYGTGPSDPGSCSGRCAQLSAELERARAALTAREAQLEALQLAYDKATAMLGRVTDERDELRRTLDDIITALESAEERIAKRLGSELDDLRAENDRLRNGWRDGRGKAT